MRVLVTGAGGMLARALRGELLARGHTVAPFDRGTLDVTDRDAVLERIGAEAPDVVVHCAAFTAVDAAEADEAGAWLVNGTATQFVAEACQKVGARLVYPSTDYVFPGTGMRPYRPNDVPSPINVYGRSKRAGEVATLAVEGSLVVRTSWLYGKGGSNFVDTIRRLARERKRLDVVDDQIGRPTWTGTLARVVVELTERQQTGIFHATDAGVPVSWFGFAREIVVQESQKVELVAVTSEEFARPAPRPKYSVLDCQQTEEAMGQTLPDWRSALRTYLSDASG